MPRVTLRYFAILGRAQPLRHVLAAAEVAFDDVRIERADWARLRGDPTFAGPFGSLPTLTWDDAVIGETLAIASFLARRLGHYDGLDDAGIARHEAIYSNCALEVGVPLGELMLTRVLHPGSDVATVAQFRLTRMVQKMDALEAMAPDGGAWFGGARAAAADFCAAEALETLRLPLGPARDAALRTRLPRLTALAERVRALPSLAAAWQTRAQRFTIMPDEPQLLAAMSAADLSALGL